MHPALLDLPFTITNTKKPPQLSTTPYFALHSLLITQNDCNITLGKQHKTHNNNPFSSSTSPLKAQAHNTQTHSDTRQYKDRTDRRHRTTQTDYSTVQKSSRDSSGRYRTVHRSKTAVPEEAAQSG